MIRFTLIFDSRLVTSRRENLVVVILAGGYGTRLAGTLENLPKPMAPANGRPFIEWIVRYLVAQGFRRFVVSTGYRCEVIEAHFQSSPVPEVEVSCVRENSPMGTAGGFLHAVRHSGTSPDGWLVVNGDSLALASLSELVDGLERTDLDGSMLGVEMDDSSRYGTVEFNEAGRLQSFREKKPGRGVINAGVYLFRASSLRLFPDRTPLSFELDVFPELIDQGAKLEVSVTQVPFLDIGTPESLAQAEAFVMDNSGAFEDREGTA